IEQPFVDPLTLLGATWPSTALADGSFIWVDLYWRVEQPLPANTILHLGLLDANNEPQQAWFNLSLAETFDRDQVIWQPGQTLRTRWQIDVPDTVPAGTYTFQLVWPEDIEQTLDFGELSVIE
ncbi:MAG: hypothetical protein R3264_19460, partial [Anaerolineae bacterium]|nr:hypothetical protein [Anaerolineae bacterium]